MKSQEELAVYALGVAVDVIGSMGVASEWSVRLDGSDPDAPSVYAEPAEARIVLKPRYGGERCYAILLRPEDDAVGAFVEKIQDSIIESSGGRTLPACPGHPHPQVAQVLDGVAAILEAGAWLERDWEPRRHAVLSGCSQVDVDRARWWPSEVDQLALGRRGFG